MWHNKHDYKWYTHNGLGMVYYCLINGWMEIDRGIIGYVNVTLIDRWMNSWMD